jgi:type II secretion system protein N
MRRTLTVVALAGIVFGTVLALTFPTDPVVRWVVSRVTPPGTTALVFARARLRPWGLRLEEVALRRPDGSAIASADSVTIRPSLAGFLRDWSGRPWHARVASCGGTLDALVERDAAGDLVTLAWKDIDVGHCPALPLADQGLAGLADGNARLRPSPRAADGDVHLRAVSWTGAWGGAPPAVLLRAEPASVRWSLAEDRLALSDIAVAGPDLEIRGAGTMRLAESVGQSLLDLDLTVAPGKDASPALRSFIDHLPPGAGAGMPRHVAVTGTAFMPQIASAP